MRYSVAFMCVLALGVMGCSETAGTGGDGGSGGIGSAGGIGGGGPGGDPIVACLPTEDRCENGTTEPHERCCEQKVPDQANACDGSESTLNPTTCTATGDTVTHRLTLMEVEDDCNVGYDLDACEGESCRWGFAPPEGMSGVDNALAGMAPIFEQVGGKVSNVNKLLSDALCGLTEDCLREVPPTEIRFVIDANASEGCANVTVLADGEASAHILNLSDDGCASGTLGTIPLTIFEVPLSLANTVVRMTVSSAGFSHGRIGATMDVDFVWVIVPASLGPGGGWDGTVPLDINASTPPTQDTSAPCNGLSATFVIGGIAE